MSLLSIVFGSEYLRRAKLGSIKTEYLSSSFLPEFYHIGLSFAIHLDLGVPYNTKSLFCLYVFDTLKPNTVRLMLHLIHMSISVYPSTSQLHYLLCEIFKFPNTKWGVLQLN